MRSAPLFNGGFIGFGLGLISSSLLFRWVGGSVIPNYPWAGYLRGIVIIGGIALAIGIVFEILERVGMRSKREDE